MNTVYETCCFNGFFKWEMIMDYMENKWSISGMILQGLSCFFLGGELQWHLLYIMDDHGDLMEIFHGDFFFGFV